MESILLVEKALEFKFSGIYHQLFHDNLLDSNKSNTNRFTVYDINFKNSFPDFLSAHDFTLLKPKLIMELTNDIYDSEDYRCLDPAIKMIPFAMNGAGDLYCFYLNKLIENEAPIVLMWHDANRLDFLAKNLSDFIFRSLLELLYSPVITLFFKNEIKEIWKSKDILHQNLIYIFEIHGKFLPLNQLQQVHLCLENVFKKEEFLNYNDLNEILNQHIWFVDFDKQIPYERN